MDKPYLPTVIKHHFDVIVIGSGFAGLSAAIECKMNGGDVLVLEKMKALGGNSIISDGGIAAPGTPEQKNLGIQDSVALMFDDMMASAEGLNDPKITQIVCDHALEAYEWSKTVLKVTYLPRVDIFGGHQVPRCYTPDPLSGSTMIQKMKQKCSELDIQILCGAYVESFILDDHHRVCGINTDINFSLDPAHIKVKSSFYATKGIIVASGGFAADLDFRRKHEQLLDETSLTTNKRTTTAEVLSACMDIGSATAHLDLIQCLPWTTPDEQGYQKGGLFGDYIISSYGILIDTQTGKRFVNELGNRKTVTQAIQKIKNVIGLADEHSVVSAGWNLSTVLKKGIVKVHPDLSDLAQVYGIPENILIKTLLTYNQDVVQGHDSDYGKPIEPWMKPLNHPPYYSMRIAPKTHYSLGGLVIDPQTHVLDHEGHILPGLFAVGEVTGLTHGANRLGSCSITECLVMGRIAGRQVLNPSL